MKSGKNRVFGKILGWIFIRGFCVWMNRIKVSFLSVEMPDKVYLLQSIWIYGYSWQACGFKLWSDSSVRGLGRTCIGCGWQSRLFSENPVFWTALGSVRSEFGLLSRLFFQFSEVLVYFGRDIRFDWSRIFWMSRLWNWTSDRVFTSLFVYTAIQRLDSVMAKMTRRSRKLHFTGKYQKLVICP